MENVEDETFLKISDKNQATKANGCTKVIQPATNGDKQQVKTVCLPVNNVNGNGTITEDPIEQQNRKTVSSEEVHENDMTVNVDKSPTNTETNNQEDDSDEDVPEVGIVSGNHVGEIDTNSDKLVQEKEQSSCIETKFPEMSIEDQSAEEKGCSTQINKKVMESSVDDKSTDVDDGDKPVNADDKAEDKAVVSEGETQQRDPRRLSRRNKSVGSFRKFFRKHKHSASIGGYRSDSFPYPTSPTSSGTSPSPLTPLADDVFNLCDITTSVEPGKATKSASESEETTSKRRYSFRSKFASLPAYTRSQSQADENSMTGRMLWRRAQKSLVRSAVKNKF